MSVRAPALIAGLCLLLSLPMSGCYGNVDSFAKTTAKHSCRRLRHCNTEEFDDLYGGDISRCRDDQYTDILDANDIAEDLECEYNADEGQKCGSTLRDLRSTCSEDADQDILDACENLYDCPGLLEPKDQPGLGEWVTARPHSTP